jgi:hypothetical protein
MPFTSLFPSRGVPKYGKYHVTKSRLRERSLLPIDLAASRGALP